ncbi:MAG: hypothetical protein JSS91_09785 [Bacteroidetes bacterium]|nr:hypothetical protein [Bacteroidota bacterium]
MCLNSFAAEDSSDLYFNSDYFTKFSIETVISDNESENIRNMLIELQTKADIPDNELKDNLYIYVDLSGSDDNLWTVRIGSENDENSKTVSWNSLTPEIRDMLEKWKGIGTKTNLNDETDFSITPVPNQPPRITITGLTKMGEDVTLRRLLKRDGFMVNIEDDFPDQLVVDIYPKSRVELRRDAENKNKYYLRLKYPNSEKSYDNYTRDRESPYKVNFKVIVIDTIAKDTTQKLQRFVFGDY